MNRAGLNYHEPISAWASYHPELFPEWISARVLAGGNLPDALYSHKRQGCVTHVISHETPSGSSALLGVRAALVRGAAAVVVLGCPLDLPSYYVYREGWKHFKDQLQGRVVAMSGWLGQFLGFPTRRWLEGLT